MSNSFGSKELEKCLKELGFILKRTSSSHAIFDPPNDKLPPIGSRPFMTVQLGRKTYDPHSANRYISQIKRFGFTKTEIEGKL